MWNPRRVVDHFAGLNSCKICISHLPFSNAGQRQIQLFGLMGMRWIGKARGQQKDTAG